MVGRAFVLLAALVSGAEAGTLVRWTAPEQCPTSANVDARVAQRVGSDRDIVPIDVTVRTDAAGFVAEIGDTRTLTSASCDELADAVALIVARIVLEQPAPIAVAIAATPIAVATTVTTAPVAPTPSIEIGARLSGASGIGAQPSIGIGAELAVPIAWGAWFVEPAGSIWKRTTADALGGTVDVALRTATLRFGRRLAQLPLRVWLAADLGELRGEGGQFMNASSGSGAWFGVGGGAAFAWRFYDQLAVVAGAELIAPIARPTFSLATGAAVYQPDAVAARLAVGIEASWP